MKDRNVAMNVVEMKGKKKLYALEAKYIIFCEYAGQCPWQVA